jgi:hypothetical protein
MGTHMRYHSVYVRELGKALEEKFDLNCALKDKWIADSWLEGKEGQDVSSRGMSTHRWVAEEEKGTVFGEE